MYPDSLGTDSRFDYANVGIGSKDALAIRFPLIEFFLWENLQAVEESSAGAEPVKTAIEDGYDFLMKVFWTRTDFQEEFQRVAQAAFGPISAFIHAQLQVTSPAAKSSQKNSKPPT